MFSPFPLGSSESDGTDPAALARRLPASWRIQGVYEEGRMMGRTVRMARNSGRISKSLVGIFLLSGLFGYGCAKRIPFSHALRLQHKLTSPELRNLQFFLSNKMAMRRSIHSGEHEVAKGRLITKFGSVIEEVAISSGTPGVAVSVREKELDVSFELGTHLTFAADPTKSGSQYRLDTPRHIGGPVTFDGLEYKTVGNSYWTHLLIDRESLRDLLKKRRKLRGVRLRDLPGTGNDSSDEEDDP